MVKHFAFLLHIPSKGKCVLWPSYYEDSQAEIDKDFREISEDLSKFIGFHTFLQREQPYKIFVKKTKNDKAICQ